MDQGFEDRRPSEHRYVDAYTDVEGRYSAPVTDYRWLEKFLPYNNAAENSVHWFIRFESIWK